MILLYILILVVGAIASYFGPWWAIAPVCSALCWWKGQSGPSAFWISALGGITLWLPYALYLNDRANADLADRVAGIFVPGAGASEGMPGIVLMAVVAALIVGLVSGFSGLGGIRLRWYVVDRHFDRRKKSP